MKRHAKKAFTALEKLGAPIYDRAEYGAHFILGGELRTSEDSYFADYWQEEVREHLNADGKVINAFGIRQDVIDILDANNLFAEWINGGMCGIYDA